ncbi:MAG: hypothetical protein AAGH15_07280 [Myxococcota bacterium]
MKTLRMLSAGAVLALALPAGAQPPPGALAGPRDVLETTRQAADAAETASQSDPPVGRDEARDAARQAAEAARQAEVAARARRAMGQGPQLSVSEADAEVPPGTIAVRIIGPGGQPIAGQPVRVGIMQSGGARDAENGTTGPEGVAFFEQLPTGGDQAYRVSIFHMGATYGATPFRLEADRGQRVQIVRLPTTRNTENVVQMIGQTMLEYRDGRVNVTMQSQLANVGEETIVFGEGLQYDLPDGFTAFQSQRGMSDQTLVPNDEGFELKGSLPPGRATLLWSFDVPLEGRDVLLSHRMPFPKTFRYRVMSDASPDMSLRVEGFPAPEAHRDQGRSILWTAVERSPQEAPLDRLTVRVTGIPGPGPLRWIAVGAALMLMFLGLLLATRGGDRAASLAKARELRKDQLLDEAAELEALFAKQEVGPRYRQRQMDAIVAELASLMRLDDAAKAGGGEKRGGKQPA